MGSPFATRHPSLGRQADKLIDLAADVRGHLLLRTVTVDHHETARFGRGEAKVAVTNTLVKETVVTVEAVPSRCSRPRRKARKCDRHGNVDQKGPLGHERPDREAGHCAEPFEVGAKAIALIREG